MSTGLILFLLLGTSLGMAARWIQNIRERGEAQKWLVSHGKAAAPSTNNPIAVNYAPEQGERWSTSLIRRWVHPEYDRRLSAIVMEGYGLTDAASRRMADVFLVENIVVYGDVKANCLARAISAPGLKRLHLYGAALEKGKLIERKLLERAAPLERIEVSSLSPSDSDFCNYLGRLPSLETVWLHQIHPSNLVAFARAPRLSEFSIDFHRTSPEHPKQGAVDPAWNAMLGEFFDELSQRDNLKRLRLFSVDLSDPQVLTRFCEASNIRYLHLEGCFVTPECLREIAKLKKLETLHLHWSPMTREHLEILATMKTLRGIHALRCDSSDVTNAAVAKLEAALPRCKITRYLK